MPIGTNHMTTTTGAVFVPEVWSSQLIVATESYLVMRDLIVDYGVIGGDKIHIPKISNLSANDKSASTAVTLQSPTESESSITVNAHKEVSFLIEDLLAAQSNYNLFMEYTNRAAYALAKAIDTDIASLYSGLSQEVGTGATAITDEVVRTAIETLDVQDVPREGRVFVFHPTVWSDLVKLERFSSVDYVNNKSVANGNLNTLYGIPVIFTNQIVQTTSGSDTHTHNMLLHREAFGIAFSIQPTMEMARKTDYLADYAVAHSAYGVAELRDEFAVEILS